MYDWTNEEISKILIQLDDLALPFSNVTLCKEMGQCKLLGQGGSAKVYEAKWRSKKKKKLALKVIGFKNRHVDTQSFEETVYVQERLSENSDNNIVKVYDRTELWVSLDEKENVISATRKKSEFSTNMTIQLQFILMEELPCVITRGRNGSVKMLPSGLGVANETEILNLAYDIGTALQSAHRQKVLHRDVKLENVFYDEKEKRYKLGDFGIAKKTADGFAETIAFTKGYVAPEVRVTDEKYDCTADIYSFGMMLYVLANKMKFPDSDTYSVNAIQYEQGYVVPFPSGNISEAFYKIIEKACNYDANQRYGSMEEMLCELVKLRDGSYAVYRREYKRDALVMGTMLLFFGIITWKLAWVPDKVFLFSFLECVFFALGLGKFILHFLEKDVTLMNLAIFAIGIFLMIKKGFSFAKLLLLCLLLISGGTVAVCVSAGMFVIYVMSLMQQMGNFTVPVLGYRWITVLLFSLSAFFLLQCSFMSMEERLMADPRMEKYGLNGFYPGFLLAWTMAMMFYLVCYGVGEYRMIFRSSALNSVNWLMVGRCGAVVTILWIAREKLIQKRAGNRREKSG